jgi:hypothetical protein
MVGTTPYADSYTALTAYTHDYDPNKQALKSRLGGLTTTLYDLYGRSRDLPAADVESFVARGFSVTLPTIAMTGTAITGGVLESEIVTGSQTIILTLTNGTWAASGTVFNALRQSFIDGLVGNHSETHSWNNDLKAVMAVTTVVRTSATVVTITTPAAATYSITTTNEIVTVTIPNGAVVYSNGTTPSCTWTPTPATFTITEGS